MSGFFIILKVKGADLQAGPVAVNLFGLESSILESNPAQTVKGANMEHSFCLVCFF